MPAASTKLIVAGLCVALSSCTALPRSAEPPVLPPGVFGVYQDNDTGAINHSAWAFGAPRRTSNSPIDAAQAVIAIEYLADELRVSPRWIEMSAAPKMQMLQARADTRRALGIAPDAPPRLVVDALLRFVAGLSAGDQAAAIKALSVPVFTLPPSQTLQILSELPYIPSANLATSEAAREAILR